MNKTDKYKISQQSKFLIYGAGTLGSVIIQRLKSHNCMIIGAVDKRSAELEKINDIQVFDLHSEKLKDIITDDTVILIAVKNVFDHAKIVNTIIKTLNFSKIVYVSPFGDDDAKMMNNVYNDLFAGEIKFPYCLSHAAKIQLQKFERSDSPIYNNDNTVTLTVPAGLIYTNYIQGEGWGDIPVMALYPHIELFNFFEDAQCGSVSSYIDFCIVAAKNNGVKITDNWKKNILENRSIIYEMMNREYQSNSDFFIENAPTAKYNKKGYFNLTSGKHRTAFLISKGCRYIPLKISLDDELAWINLEQSQKLFDKLQNEGIDNLPCPIDNPFFYNYPCPQSRYWFKVLTIVTQYIYKYCRNRLGTLKLNKLTLCMDYNSDDYMRRHFSLMGINIIEYHNLNKTDTCDILYTDVISCDKLKFNTNIIIGHDCDESLKDKANCVLKLFADDNIHQLYVLEKMI